jgi:hypothetical protein
MHCAARIYASQGDQREQRGVRSGQFAKAKKNWPGRTDSRGRCLPLVTRYPAALASYLSFSRFELVKLTINLIHSSRAASVGMFCVLMPHMGWRVHPCARSAQPKTREVGLEDRILCIGVSLAASWGCGGGVNPKAATNALPQNLKTPVAHMFLVIEENDSFSSVYHDQMPWLGALWRINTGSQPIIFPMNSLMEYLRLSSGSNEQNFACDGSQCKRTITENNIFRQLCRLLDHCSRPTKRCTRWLGASCRPVAAAEHRPAAG